ncbi:MAG: hypothetical protein QM784_31250 [Polyangiaceae bacterium]
MTSALPAKVDVIVSRCLEKSVDARYPDVYELAVELAELAPASGAATLARLRCLGEVVFRAAGFDGDTRRRAGNRAGRT